MTFDFRSDTVTKPEKAMREAMMIAEVGDDLYNDDPTVHRLEAKIASLCGKEASLFTVTGVMANQLAIRVHLCEPMLSVICDRRSHLFNHENGGVAYHSAGTLIPIDPLSGKQYITAKQCEDAIIHEEIYHATTRLISLENTLGGVIFPLDEIEKIRTMATQNKLKMHLDGARLWNACIATGHSPIDYCQHFDTVTLCFSKGLGAPIGSILVGSRDFIEKARKYRKLFGGGWRQAGILAAGAIYALDHNFHRLKEDHENASYLAKNLKTLGFAILNPVDTNIVFADLSPLPVGIVAKKLKENGIIIAENKGTTVRFVTHLQTPRQAIDQLLQLLKAFRHS